MPLISKDNNELKNQKGVLIATERIFQLVGIHKNKNYHKLIYLKQLINRLELKEEKKHMLLLRLELKET
jgi:hypothetical protein